MPILRRFLVAPYSSYNLSILVPGVVGVQKGTDKQTHILQFYRKSSVKLAMLVTFSFVTRSESLDMRWKGGDSAHLLSTADCPQGTPWVGQGYKTKN